MVPNTYIVAQARQHTNEKLPIQVPSFFESTQEIIPFAESSSGFPITLVIQDQMPKRTDNLENDADDIAAVFEHWKITMHHPRAKLCRKRKTLIRRALDDFSVEELCEAITGCSLTPHNIGKNEQGQRYDGLHIILKDEDQIERFIYNYNNPPKPYNKAYKRLEDNRCELIEWSKNKHNEYALENGHG